MIWGYLAHIGCNMWFDPEWTEGYYEGAMRLGTLYTAEHNRYLRAQNQLRFDRDLFRKLAKEAADTGVNLFVLDLGEGIRYESHPEISAAGAIEKRELTELLAYLRGLGIEPVPKLNFSACHHMWLGKYARMLTLPEYYTTVSDLIAEVCELFGKPRFFHLGMDEETAQHQIYNLNVSIRQGDLWWHDLFFYFRELEKRAATPWIWSDYYWRHPALFLERMPKDVILNNWYYSDSFDTEIEAYKNCLFGYEDMDKHGYRQIPTGSNWSKQGQFEKLVEYCMEKIGGERLLGFLQTPWKPTLPEHSERLFGALGDMKNSITKYGK